MSEMDSTGNAYGLKVDPASGLTGSTGTAYGGLDLYQQSATQGYHGWGQSSSGGGYVPGIKGMEGEDTFQFLRRGLFSRRILWINFLLPRVEKPRSGFF